VGDGAFVILVNQVASMFVMLAVGYALYRGGLVRDEGIGSLSNVVMFVASPALTIEAFQADFDAARLVSAAWCFGLTLALMALAALLAKVVYRHHDDVVARFGVVFSNMGFVGIPLVQSLLGTEYIFLISSCIAAFTLFAWTYGVLLISGGDRGQVSLRKVFTNPAVLAFFVGLALYVLCVSLPVPALLAVESLGAMNTGLAMVVLDAYLAQADLGALLRDASVYKVSLLRLVLVPVACSAVLALLPEAWVTFNARLVVLIAMATPLGAMTAMLASMYGADYRHAAGTVSVSTLLSLVTMPVVLTLGMAVL